MYNGELAPKLIEKLIRQKGLDTVKKCIGEFTDYVDGAKKVENAFYDFVKKYGTHEAYTKGTGYRNHNYKPIQATNYEQREYDDEFFDSLYVDLDKWK